MAANKEEWVARQVDRGPNVTRFKPVPDDDGAGGHQRPKLDTIWADDIRLDLDKVGLVDGLLETTGLTVVYGESGSGKTFAVLDLACHVAAGLPWRGMKVEQGVVLYIAAESPGSVQRRLWAWKRRHEVDHLPVLVVRSSVDLLNGSVDALVELVGQVRERTGKKVALVVVDTLARAMTGNENAPEDMGRFVTGCGRIGEAAEGHVVVVHHSGKDTAKGARGHSSLRAATDCEMEVTRSGDDRTLSVRKSRDGEDGAAYGFKLETVELGTNPNGRVITTCVAAPTDAQAEPVTKVTKQPGGKNQRVTLDALKAAVSDKGTEVHGVRDIPGRAKGVSVQAWTDYAFRYLPQATTKEKGQAFKRSMEALVADRFVRHVDGFVWLPSDDGNKGHKGHISENVTSVTEPSRRVTEVTKVTHPFRGVTFVTVPDEGGAAEAEAAVEAPAWVTEPNVTDVTAGARVEPGAAYDGCSDKSDDDEPEAEAVDEPGAADVQAPRPVTSNKGKGGRPPKPEHSDRKVQAERVKARERMRARRAAAKSVSANGVEAEPSAAPRPVAANGDRRAA